MIQVRKVSKDQRRILPAAVFILAIFGLFPPLDADEREGATDAVEETEGLRKLVTAAPEKDEVTEVAGLEGTDKRSCPEGLVLIPGGTFMMGSPRTEEGRYPIEGPGVQVTVSGFCMGRHEVTQGEWFSVMGDSPSYFEDCAD